MVRIVRKDGLGRFFVLDNHGRRMHFDGSCDVQPPVLGTRVEMFDLRHQRFSSEVFCAGGEDPDGGPSFSGYFYRAPTLQSIVEQLDQEVSR